MNTFVDETPVLTTREWLALAVLALVAAGEIELEQSEETRSFYKALANKCDGRAVLAAEIAEVF